MGVSVGTVQRLEAGDPGVAIGSLAMALLAFGQLDRLLAVLPESQDDIGQMVDRQNLPRRVRNGRQSRPAEPERPADAGTVDGAAF